MNEKNKKSGWVRLYRSVTESWMWKDKPFSKGQAWIDIILMANHEERNVGIGNQIIDVQKGSFITSMVKLGERWGWNKDKVSRYLKQLQSDAKVQLNTQQKCTVVTLVNWDFYQIERSDDETMMRRKCADDEKILRTNNTVTINNKQVTNNKNTLDHPPADRTQNDALFDAFWRAYPRKIGKAAAMKSWKKIRMNEQLFHKIMTAVEQAKHSAQWQQNNGQYIPHPTTWLNQGRWDDEMPANGYAETEFTQEELNRIERGVKLGQRREDIEARIRQEKEDDARKPKDAVFT